MTIVRAGCRRNRTLRDFTLVVYALFLAPTVLFLNFGGHGLHKKVFSNFLFCKYRLFGNTESSSFAGRELLRTEPLRQSSTAGIPSFAIRYAELNLSEFDVGILSVCDEKQDSLCVYHNGQVSTFHIEENPICSSTLVDGYFLQALELDQFSRLLIHRPSVPIVADHLQAAIIGELVFSDPTMNALADVWAVSPQRHKALFELVCQLAEVDGVSSIDDLFQQISFAAAFFPKRLGGASTMDSTEPKHSANSARAFVTFISSGTHDWYVESVRLINFKIKQLCKAEERAPLIVMLLAGVHNISQRDSFVPILEKEGIQVHVVPDVKAGKQRDGRFVGIWGKQRLWQLVDYHKVVFIDPDQLVLRCPSSLFRYPQYSHGQTWVRGRNTFNSGVLIVRPSLMHMQAVEEAVLHTSTSNDQTFTESYFDGRGFSIPEYYSIYKRHAYKFPAEWGVWKHCAHFLHFTGEKPWDGEGPEQCKPAYAKFFVEYNKFKRHSPLGPLLPMPYDMTGSRAAPEVIESKKCMF